MFINKKLEKEKFHERGRKREKGREVLYFDWYCVVFIDRCNKLIHPLVYFAYLDDMDKEELARLQTSAEQTKLLSHNIITKVNNKLEELHFREERLKKIERVIEKNASKVENKVDFNVGGKRFSTTKDTLFTHPDTYFSSLLGSAQFKVPIILLLIIVCLLLM